MAVSKPLSEDEKSLFKETFGDIKPIEQDKVVHAKKTPMFNRRNDKFKTQKQNAQFYFSDEFEPNLNANGPVQYVKEGSDTYAAKSLRRGNYAPDLILDLHGLDQHQAKEEIAALLYACQKEHAQCVCIVHGLGGYVLKNKVPHWLVQHPDVLAFHQAPLEWGGKGALLVLIDLKDKFS